MEIGKISKINFEARIKMAKPRAEAIKGIATAATGIVSIYTGLDAFNIVPGEMAENTLFDEIHKELDAKMVPAGKWNMPLFYPGGTLAEHRNTFTGASLFDMTGVRAFQVAGENIGSKLDKLFMYDSRLAVGAVRDNFLLHDDGTLAVSLTVCRMQENDFMLLVDRNTPDKECDYLLTALPIA